MKKFIIVIFLACGGAGLVLSSGGNSSSSLPRDLLKDHVAAMEREIEDLRRELKIPGMSVAIGVEDSIIFSRGFGWADIDLCVPVTENSLFHLASLTKPYATTVILQLVQEGKLDLNSPVSNFGVEFDNSPGIRLHHVLSHTSSGEPGTVFKYDGNRFGQLEKVIEEATGNSFVTELKERILKPLDLKQTIPNPLDQKSFKEAEADHSLVQKYFVTEYAREWGRVIWPSGLFGPLKPIDHPEYFGTAAGLVATARDVAIFSAALDKGFLLDRSLYELSLTPVKNPEGKNFPFGYGWFLENYKGHQIAWQYGHWFGSSSLIIKVPEHKITMVILANSDGLSSRTRIGDKATINASPAGPVLLDRVLENQLGFRN